MKARGKRKRRAPQWDGIYHVYGGHVGGNERHVGHAIYLCGRMAEPGTASWTPDKATCSGCRDAVTGKQLVLPMRGPKPKQGALL